MNPNQSNIVNFFTGRSILITGASGFIGKALVYKLLTICPEIGEIFILVRDKRGLNCEQRLTKILENKCFDEIRSTDCDRLNKVKSISGDISIDGLGISDDQLKLLQENVSVIIHSAATVKFNEKLRQAVNINLVGTRRMIKLAHSLTKLKAFVHVSTSYSNCDLETIENKIYPQKIDPQQLIDCTNWMSDDMINDILPKLLDKRPNTYTLTKALAETLIASESDNLPIAIIRPSIVTPSHREPGQGWADNLNNVVGISQTISVGVTRVMIADSTKAVDMIPVDMVVNMILAIVWHLSDNCDQINSDQHHYCNKRPPMVFNCTSGQQNPCTAGEAFDRFVKSIRDYPDSTAIRSPSLHLTTNQWINNSIVIVDQYIPSLILDIIFTLIGKKPKMVKTCKKINSMLEPFEFFNTRDWTFDTTTMVELFNSLNKVDQKLFNFDVKSIDWSDYIGTVIIGLRQFTSSNGNYNLDEARKRMERTIKLERILEIILILMAGLLIYKLIF
ncbi:putative fatty acyl-CoA reductase CG5065 [Panonychus citri]|uniref:putative fatty acyl-CoA reductase CG5065 n=1 Tax=Panonychus citri TaxID=50023 RepID=UPI0023072A1D|nr:putative fatty acyl-CoA reductase CG5065 [Panonychus citri]